MDSSNTTKPTEPTSTLTQVKPNVYLITLESKQITWGLLKSIHEHLDVLDKVKTPLALVTTSSFDNCYNEGIEFDIFLAEKYYFNSFLRQFMQLLARIMKLGYPTIAAINGHCYAGGTMLAMAHDFRFMRDDKGKFCMKEVEMGMPLCQGLLYPIRVKVKSSVAARLAIFAERFNQKECLEAGIVDRLVPIDQLVDLTISFGEKIAKDAPQRSIMRMMKTTLYQKAIDACEKQFLTEAKDVPM